MLINQVVDTGRDRTQRFPTIPPIRPFYGPMYIEVFDYLVYELRANSAIQIVGFPALMLDYPCRIFPGLRAIPASPEMGRPIFALITRITQESDSAGAYLRVEGGLEMLEIGRLIESSNEFVG